MEIIRTDDAYWDKEIARLRSEYPGSHFGSLRGLTAQDVDDFEDALLSGPEEAIQAVLTRNPYLIQYAIPNSGHHGVWVYPKQMIRPRSADGVSGMIPDFLVISRSSLGDFVRIVELKRFSDQFSDQSGSGYSTVGHRALSQCNGYLQHFATYIDSVRANTRIISMAQPSGAIILIGNSAVESPAQQRNRSDFVRNSNKIDVVSYRRILLGARSDVGFTTRGWGLLRT